MSTVSEERISQVAREGLFTDDEAMAIVERIDRMADHDAVRLALDNLAVVLTQNGYDSTLVYMLLNSCAPAFHALRESGCILHGT